MRERIPPNQFHIIRIVKHAILVVGRVPPRFSYCPLLIGIRIELNPVIPDSLQEAVELFAPPAHLTPSDGHLSYPREREKEEKEAECFATRFGTTQFL